MILKLKRTPGIFLVGFMGCGKTTVGRRLARELGWQFVDLDADIEGHHRMSISHIFEQYGEAVFRDWEHEALARRVNEIKRGRPTVVSLGGGAFVAPSNVDLIDSAGLSIWIDCAFDVIKHRVATGGHRPLARDQKQLQELFEQRRAPYSRADYHVPVSVNDSDAVFRQILELPIF